MCLRLSKYNCVIKSGVTHLHLIMGSLQFCIYFSIIMDVIFLIQTVNITLNECYVGGPAQPSPARSKFFIESYTVYPRTPDEITDQEINCRLLLCSKVGAMDSALWSKSRRYSKNESQRSE